MWDAWRRSESILTRSCCALCGATLPTRWARPAEHARWIANEPGLGQPRLLLTVCMSMSGYSGRCPGIRASPSSDWLKAESATAQTLWPANRASCPFRSAAEAMSDSAADVVVVHQLGFCARQQRGRRPGCPRGLVESPQAYKQNIRRRCGTLRCGTSSKSP